MTATRAVEIAATILRENDDTTSPRFARLTNAEHQALEKLINIALPEALGQTRPDTQRRHHQ